MIRNGKGRRLRGLKWTLLCVLMLFIFTPYLFPISAPAAMEGTKPFENSAFMEVNGISFHYRTYPARGGAVKGKLLLVHGLAGSTFSFEVSAPLVSQEGYFVVSVDLPGFGYSDRNPAYDHSQANRAKDLWGLLSLIDQGMDGDAAALPWHLAGHSMGGGTAAAMAMQDPSRVKSLVFVDAALFENPGGGGFLTIPPLNRWVLTALEHFLITENRIKSLLSSAYGTEPTNDQVRNYLLPLRLPGTARSLINMVGTAKNEDPEKLKDLAVPLFAVWGSQDTWVPREELDRLMAIRPDTVFQIVEGAAHCPMETHPDIFVDIMVRWLSESLNTVSSQPL